MLAVARLAGKVGGLTEVFFTGLCGVLPAPKCRGGGLMGGNGGLHREGRQCVGVKKAVIFFVVGLMIAGFGCGGRTNSNSDVNTDCPNTNSIDISINTWILKDTVLAPLLSDFIQALDEHATRENPFICILYFVINDSTYFYTLSENASSCKFMYGSPHILFIFENRLICFEFGGLHETPVFKINNDFFVEFTKKNYPDQYEYYLEFGECPPPPGGAAFERTYRFQNGKLIDNFP